MVASRARAGRRAWAAVDSLPARILLLAIAYGLAAQADALLRMQPAAASPVWPAAGIALAGLLLGGPRLWPGVLLGHFSFSLSQYLPGPLEPGMLVTSLAYAIGPTLQAACAAWFVRRERAGLMPARDGAVLRTVLLAGPVSCVIAATWGVTGLTLQGYIGAGEVASTWILWWFGDTLGMLLFAPLVLLVMPGGQRYWPRRNWTTVLPILGTIAILVPGVYWFHSAEEAEARRPLSLQAERAFDLTASRLQNAANAILATGHYFATEEAVSAAEFNEFASRIVSDGVREIAWIPRVTDADRESFEAEARSGGQPDYRILERGEGGDYRTAARRAEYFPLRYLDAPSESRRPFGFDLASEPVRRATLERARDTGMPTASEPVLRYTTGRLSVVLIVPIYAPGTDGTELSVEERRRTLRGFVGGVIDPEAVSSALIAETRAGLTFRIADIGAGDVQTALTGPDADPLAADGTPLLSREIDFHDRRWRFDVAATGSYWQPGQSGKSQAFLLAALIGAFLIAVQTLTFTVRDRAIGLKVIARSRELADSRRRLVGAQELAGIAGWELDVASGQMTLDDRSYEILGTDAGSEGGYHLPVRNWIRRFVHPQSAGDVERALSCAAAAGDASGKAPIEFRIERADGETRHLLMHVDVETGGDGSPRHVFGSWQDITDRKNIEIALRNSEQYNRSIVESSRDCMMVLSLAGELLDINGVGCSLLGDDDGAAAGRDDSGPQRGRRLDNLWTLDAHAAAAVEAVRRAAAGGTARFTGQTFDADGKQKWWDVVVSPILDSDGRPRNLLCVTRDVSDEHAAQEAIRRINQDLEAEIERRNADLVFSERELRAIFDVAAVGIAHIDRNNRVLRVNPKLCEITGFEPDAFVEENHFSRTHADDRAREQRLVARLMGGEIDTYELEKRYLRADDRHIWVRVTGSLVRDADGEPVYRVEVVDDISEARAESTLREASESRYRELFDRNPVPMWTYDNETLAFTSVNEAAIAHYGYSREEFLAMTLRDIRPADQLPILDKRLKRKRSGNMPAFEVVHRKKDGSRITVEITSHDLQAHGRPVRLVLANDVTERNRANALLEGQKSVLEAITSGASVEESLDTLARLAESAAPGVRCSILLGDPRRRELRHAAAPSLGPGFTEAVDESTACGKGFFAAIADCCDAVIVTDIATDPRWASLRDVAVEHEVQACWSTPILDAAGDILGAFVMYYAEQRKPRALEGELVETLTQTAAIAIGKDRETRKLEESQEKFRATFETAALGILHVAPNGKFIRANPSITRICGYSERELRDMDADTLSHPDDVDLGQAERARMFAGEIPSYGIEKRYIRKDGSTVWCNVTLSTVRNKNGAVDYAVALVEDISWRKAAEAELHRQQEINRLLLENLTEGVVACDADGRLMLFNKAAREWHGADPREIPPTQWSEYYNLCEGDGETPLATENIPLMRAFRGERVKGVEMSIVRKGHPPRIVLASGAPLLDADGEKRGAVVVMHDVTLRRQSLKKLERAAEELKAANATVERERASLAQRVAERTAALTAANAALESAKEAAEAASRAKSTFLAVMSHEIRTPMNGILGMADVLSQSSLADDQEDAVRTIRDSSFALLRLIDDILDFSKVEAGRLELEFTPLSIADVVETVCDSLTPEALSNGVDLRLFVDPGLPDSVLSDPTRLRQLLYNLIGNAIKFSGGRDGIRGRVQVTVERVSDAPLEIAFRIVDNGVGIDSGVLPRLFDSFTQAEVSTTRRFGGTGLGLAITKRLVDLMKGSIDVSSEPGNGSDFVVRLPLTAAGGNALPPEFDLRDVHIVLLEDDECDAAALAAYLDSAGARVTRCRQADELPEPVPASGELVVFVQQLAVDAPSDEVLVDACADRNDQVNLLITRGLRVTARIVAPHIVAMQASAIRRRDFLRAVAVAAGRASPETARAAEDELVRGQLVAPTVSQARTDGRLILVAEDDPINQKVILRQLALLGYAGELAGNGSEALEMWRKGDYSLLLTDLHMPEMDGYELTRRIRAAEPCGSRLPIIALTANALRGEAERAERAGVDAFLTKPLQLAVLSAALEKWAPAVRPEDHSSYVRAAVAASQSSPALDTEILTSVIGNDPALQREFLHEYLDATADQIVELAAAVADGDSRRLVAHAHQQKGAARAIGATRLGDLCAELENAARAEDQALARQLLAQFEMQAAAVTKEIFARTGKADTSAAGIAARRLGAKRQGSSV